MDIKETNTMMMSSARRLTPEFKAQGLELIKAGQPVREVADDLGVSSSLVYQWRSQAQQNPHLGSGGERSVADEMRVLRRKIADLQLENDILKKAAIILWTNPQKKAAQ
jgi:transposase